MIVFVRFPADPGCDPVAIESAVQGAAGRAGTVIGASRTSIDLEVPDPDRVEEVMRALAEALRDLGLPASAQLDVPATGRRLGIYDF